MSNIIREIVATNEFTEYYNALDQNIKEKYDYVLQIVATQKIVNTKFVKKLEKTEFYELRVSISTNEYRTIMVAIDKSNFIEAKQIVLLNSFLKKDTKQYKAEIKRASEILKKLED